jgi:hypothetical protein
MMDKKIHDTLNTIAFLLFCNLVMLTTIAALLAVGLPA